MLNPLCTLMLIDDTDLDDCSKCGKRFSEPKGKYKLLVFIRKDNTSVATRWFFCSDCPVCYPSKETLLVCIHCGKNFTLASSHPSMAFAYNSPEDIIAVQHEFLCCSAKCAIKTNRIMRKTASGLSGKSTKYVCPCLNGANKLCSRCRSIAYCSEECQSKDWKEHKKMCKKTQRIIKKQSRK